ncbi:MAG: single-stranded DNA-binding protein [Thermoguttaceae bacterium]|nr:single-stranded DNA-binding protein [Thermoguttaceae bacterium]MDW8078781.1 single-stranded DNA-binding protein [Thermoguttaceae bacterium]
MASFNRVILLGNLTRDPEIRYTPSGTPVMDIGLAVNERRRNASGEWVDEPVFVEVTLWGRTAEVANEYLSKGSPVLIEGRLRLDTWETSDGQRRSRLRVVAERMQMLGRAMGADQATAAGERGEPTPSAEETRDIPEEGAPFDDLPF